MKTTRLIALGMTGALMLSAAAQADETNNTVTSEQLREQSRQYAAESGRSLGVDNAAIQVNETQVMQSGSRTGTPVQTRTREQKQLRTREHAYQGNGSGSRYGRGYESRGGYGGSGYGGNRSGAGGSSRSGGQGGGRR